MKPQHKIMGLILLSCLMVGCGSTTKTAVAQPKNSSQQLADYNVQLGVGYIQQGDMPRAKQKLLSALEKAPNWPPALEAMAYYYQMTGDPERAKDYYLQALRIAPHDGATLNNYGRFICLQGKYKESLSYFEQAIADQNYLKTADANENAGLCAAKIPNYRLAEQYLQRAIQQNPSRLMPLLDLADIMHKQGKNREAVKYLNVYASQAELPPAYVKLRSNLQRKLH